MRPMRKRVAGRRRGKKLDLRRALFLLPNLATTASIFCGFQAILVVSGDGPDRFGQAAVLILFSMFLDTIDGRLARLTRTQSAFGVQLDSLADVIAFGVAPAMLAHAWALSPLGLAAVGACFLYVAAGTIRLARFNVLTTGPSGAPRKPGRYILGLPIPGAAGLVVALVVLDGALDGAIVAHPEVVLGTMIGLAALMVSSLRFRSFKDLHPTPASIAFVLAVVGIATLLAVRLHVSAALVWLLAAYVGLALVETVVRWFRKLGPRRDTDDDADEVAGEPGEEDRATL